MTFEPVIGLEIHAQLQTRTKIFCGCSTAFGALPNTQVCPVCLGLPGALPVLNRQAVDLAIMAAHVLGCEIQSESVFARKNYFYPDLPKGYQISQFERPLALDGSVRITGVGFSRSIGLTRIHMEEDAGKSIHEGFADSDQRTYLDYNRSGTPLIEIVSEPEMRSAAEAAAFFEQVRDLLVGVGVNDGNMEEGSLRCDGNVSVRPTGHSAFGTKVEIKNLNSFRYLHNAIEYEIERQIEVIEGGGRVVQETRLWDASAGRTVSMRSKEEAHDYRYFPEPDLPPLVVDAERIARVLEAKPETPEERRERFVALGLPGNAAAVLVQSKGLADFFERANELFDSGRQPTIVCNWLTGDFLRILKERGEDIRSTSIDPERFVEMLTLIDQGTISNTIGKTVLERMFASPTASTAIQIVRTGNLTQNNDEGALLAIVHDVMAKNADAVAQYKAGSAKTFGFLVGQLMKASGGKANPKVANDLLKRELERA